MPITEEAAGGRRTAKADAMEFLQAALTGGDGSQSHGARPHLLSITQFTFEQAVDVRMRHFSSQYQHQIAAAYVINVRAVNHVLKEKTHLAASKLPRRAVEQVSVSLRPAGRSFDRPAFAMALVIERSEKPWRFSGAALASADSLSP